jgi:hypothetical protein
MSDFLNSVKADLLDRRLLPFVALIGAALLAALVYVLLSGGSSTSTPPPSLGAPPAPIGISVSGAAANPAQPVAETTSGASLQRHGFARNPFTPLPGAAKTASSTSTTTTTIGSTSTTTSGGSSTTGTNVGSGSAPKGEAKPAPSTPSKPSTPKRETVVYRVSVLFGALPTVPPPGGVQLTPYNSLRLLTALPSAKQSLIVFRGVTAASKSATFTVVGEAILRGNATCLPSPAQCEEIDLKPGQAEQLEYLPENGQAVTYELRLVSITSTKASSAMVASLRRGESKAGREVLRSVGLLAVPGMRYSSDSVGVLSFLGHPSPAR